MIKKLICRLFGCRIQGSEVTVTTTGQTTLERMVHVRCPRCDKLHYFRW